MIDIDDSSITMMILLIIVTHNLYHNKNLQ